MPVEVHCNAPHSLYDLGGSCANVPAGDSCTAVAGSNAHRCIEPGQIKFTCPAGNVVNSGPYLVSEHAVRCRVCSVSAHVADENPAKDYFSGTIQWGPNMINGTVDETMIDRYYVLIVDDCDVVRSVAGMLPKRTGLRTGCCEADAYKLKVQVALPPKYHRFSIMAVKDATPKFIVQGGLTSGPIIDSLGKSTTSGVSSPFATHLVLFFCVAVAAQRSSS